MTPVLFLLLLALAAPSAAGQEPNPPLPGFDMDGSDPEAIAIADQVMTALGGRKAWDETRYIKWKFFGRRLHVWDKYTGRLRFENENQVVLMNINTQDGRAWQDGQEVTDPKTLAETRDKTYRAWINDSYWMFMPYKLKDSGVTLKYLGEGETSDGAKAQILELTFSGVGVTPENKYHVYVDPATHLVSQWDYYAKAEDAEPRLSTPWTNWQRYGKILLSDGRGDRSHTDIAVYETLPDSVFESPDPVDWTKLEP